MKSRIKEVRKDNHLTQAKFAERIGLKQNTIAQIETGKRTPSEQVVLSICREFGVFREWLETGKGPKYKKKPEGGIEQEIADILGKDDPFAVAILSALVKAPPELWEIWRKELYRVIDEQKNSGE